MHSIIYESPSETLNRYRLTTKIKSLGLSALDLLAFSAMCLSYALFTMACMSV